MQPIGWLLMIVSVGSVLTLVSFCLFRVLTLPPIDVEDLNIAPLEIDTHDRRDMD